MIIRNFLSDDSGAITVDWVVLTAAIVTLCLGLLFSISNSTTSLASDVNDGMEWVGEQAFDS